MATLEIKNLKKKFRNRGTPILNHLNARFESGNINGIFGRNGSGKSTLFKILFGTLRFDNGEFLLNKKQYQPKNNIPKQQIAFLPQDSFLPQHLKVRDLIPMFHKDMDVQRKIFYEFDIPNLDHKSLGELSEGKRKYIELLLVINLHHPIILLDEPFAMIEPLYKDKIKEIIRSLKGIKTIILSDHYYEDVLAISDQNFVLSNGNLNQISSKEDLKLYNYLR